MKLHGEFDLDFSVFFFFSDFKRKLFFLSN